MSPAGEGGKPGRALARGKRSGPFAVQLVTIPGRQTGLTLPPGLPGLLERGSAYAVAAGHQAVIRHHVRQRQRIADLTALPVGVGHVLGLPGHRGADRPRHRPAHVIAATRISVTGEGDCLRLAHEYFTSSRTPWSGAGSGAPCVADCSATVG